MATNKYFTSESLELFVDKIKEYTDNAVSQVEGACIHEELTNEEIDAILGPLDGGTGDDSGSSSGSGSSGSSSMITDATLTQLGMAADAKATGDAINTIKSNMVKSINGTKPDSNGNISISSINGEDGATFVPSIDEDGNLSWSNNKNLDNPSTVNIKPVKGTDYWTETELSEIKTELIQDVIDALPNAEGVWF